MFTWDRTTHVEYRERQKLNRELMKALGFKPSPWWVRLRYRITGR